MAKSKSIVLALLIKEIKSLQVLVDTIYVARYNLDFTILRKAIAFREQYGRKKVCKKNI